jgi:hypothetical protein
VLAQSSRDLTEPTGTEANRLKQQLGGYYGYYGGVYRSYAYVPGSDSPYARAREYARSWSNQSVSWALWPPMGRIDIRLIRVPGMWRLRWRSSSCFDGADRRAA